jgi:mannose-6-phosphate isomerase-like protein (cupin superfamily)
MAAPAAARAVKAVAKVVQPSEMKFNPHPQFKGVQISFLLSKRDDAVDVTCAIVRWAVGAQFDKHIHENADDILYFIQGKAKVWIDGVGDFPVGPGSFVRIPKGVLHQPHDIEEEVVAHDMWFPATV